MSQAQMTIVVEGKEYVPIMQTVLKETLRDMEVNWNSSNQSASSLAQSMLLKKRHPVLLVLNSVSAEPTRGEERRNIVHQLLYIVADREFWEVAIADPNIEAWRVAGKCDAEKLIVKTPDLKAAVAFLQRVKNGEVVVPR